MRAMKVVVVELDHGIMGERFRLGHCGCVCWWRWRQVLDRIGMYIVEVDVGVQAEELWLGWLV